MKVFLTTSSWLLGKLYGIDAGAEEFQRQLREPEIRGAVDMPSVRTILRLRELADIELRVDSGATVIAKARSRAFHAALHSDADVWVSVDDDVEATLATLDWLLGAVHDVEPRICCAPTFIRGASTAKPTIEADIPIVRVERSVPSFSGKHPPGQAVQINNSGFGLVAMNRPAMRAMAELADEAPTPELTSPGLEYLDDDGIVRLALFREEFSDRWYGEDRSFWRRVPRHVSKEALTTGTTKHGGYPLDLQWLK